MPDDHPNGGSRAVDAKHVPAPTGALVVDARGVAVGRDGAVPNAGSDQTAEAQTPEAETTKPKSESVTASQRVSGAAGQTRLPVETFRQTHVGAAASVPEALRVLRAAVVALANDTHDDGSLPPFSSGLVRFTVSVPRHVDALEWLRGARANASRDDGADARSLLPAYYLSPRTPPPAVRSGDGDDAAGDGDDVTYGRGAGTTASGASDRGNDATGDCRSARRNDVAEPSSWRADPRGAVAAAGGAVVWTGGDGFDGDVLADVRRFLQRSAGGSDETGPRVYGAGRFDPATAPAEEWARFGGHYFFLPTLEVAEGARSATVAVAVAWDAARGEDFAEASEDAASEDAAETPTARPRRSAKCAASLAAAAAAAADAIDAALGTPAEPRKRVSEKSRRKSLAPPGSATPLGKTLEPDRAGWSVVVGGLLKKLREGEAAAAEAARRAERAVAAAEAAAERDSGTSSASEAPFTARDSDVFPPEAGRYVWDERDAYGEDAYIDDFASGDGYGGGAVSTSGRSIRDRLLDLGRAAGVEAPPAAVLKELEAFAMAAGLGSSAGSPADGTGGVFSGNTFAARGKTRVDANAGDAGSVGIGWSVDESVDDDDDDLATAASALSRSAFSEERTFLKSEAGAEAEASTSTSSVSSVSSVSSSVESTAGDAVDSPLRKVVLARRSTLTFREPMDALALVSALRSRDPDAYQFALVCEDGAAFVGSTPERLFSSRDGRAASEAVAGTRPRGADEGEDAALAYEMLLSPKEHEEFSIVREEVRAALAAVARDGASGVKAELEKGVLRHVSVQHLYARLGCELADGTSEADVLRALHPTPAVCGHPRVAALDAIRGVEPFDRGLYAGPLGWIGAESAEFAVAIRSALLETTTTTTNETSNTSHPEPPGTVMRLYAGVGVVAAADAVAEWRELNLKTTPLESLVAARDGTRSDEDRDASPFRFGNDAGGGLTPLALAPNANQAWADVLIGELFRDGVRVFCVAPGSRSTPLALAAERHSAARVVVCVDERSLAFYALGVGKGAGAGAAGAAVITSSGTAVANLLPAAVEAAESNSPLLLLTADRPPELRGSGANQTIDQTKIFGSFARFEADLPPPGDGAPARVWATAANAATRVLRGARPGPVHLNCQFRDPLGPVSAPWNPERDLRGLEGWESRVAPLSFAGGAAEGGGVHDGESRAAASDAAGVAALARLARSARRGVLVIAGGASDGAAAALAATELAAGLGWAVVADAASGVRAGGGDPASFCPHVLNVADVSLCSASMRAFFKPDVIVQVNPRLTSKRVQTALEAAALDGGAAWAVVTPQEARADPAHCVSLHVSADAATATAALSTALGFKETNGGSYRASSNFASCASFRDALLAADAAAAREARRALRDLENEEGITEMGVALAVADALPRSMGLFLGNSMPIRDVDALAGIAKTRDESADFFARGGGFGGFAAPPVRGSVPFGPGAPTAANRGASGIDGVLSAAAGFAAGLGRPTTLLVGDVSFQHDANGLLLLRERPGQPPVTVVVVNNGGGGIFSFLPVADQIDAPKFTKLFATPPDVSRRGLCDAHRVAHAHPSTPAALRNALRAAWAEGRHSVVEVTTSRARNLAQHKELQRRVAEAVDAALALEKRFSFSRLGKSASRGAEAEAEAEADPTGSAHPRAVVSATASRFALPMLREPTTFVDPVIDSEEARRGVTKRARAGTTRVGYILEVRLANGAVGRGEASPLPGLHRESAAEAGAQLRVVAHALESAVVPATLPLLGGAVTDWLCETVGIRVVDALLPSVRFALESAVLSALVAGGAAPSETTKKTEKKPENAVALADALAYGAARVSNAKDLPRALSNQSRAAVEINALIAACDGDTPESAAREAAALVTQGYRCLKIKVARGVGAAGAAADADRVEAIRDAVGPDVALRCDANRGWSLNDALAFGLRAMRFDLQYVEEPVRDIESDLAAFHCTTGVPVALDESVDDALLRARKSGASVADALEELFEPTFGVVALVLKPGVLGGLEACAAAAAAARTKGVNAVVTTAFESGVGVSACAHLAAALDAAAERAAFEASSSFSNRRRMDDDDDSDSVHSVPESRSSRMSPLDDDAHEPAPVASRLRAMQHGLGTGAWLDGDVTATPRAPIVSMRDAANGNQSGGIGVALESDGEFGNVAPFVTSVVTAEETSIISRSREIDSILSPSSAVVWGSIEVREVVTSLGTYRFRIRDSRGRDDDAKGSASTRKSDKKCSVLFLHGFMGGMEDWDAVARGLAPEARCVAADMPGHGGTTFLPANGTAEAEGYGIEAMAEAVAKLGDSLFGGDDDAPVTVVGYSMGARVALATAAACAPSFLKKKRGGGVVSIGGSPGIAGESAKRARAERDDALAEALRASGVEPFARAWYTQGLFGSLTAHPRFSVARLARRRAASLQNARVRNGDDASASAAASAAAERLAATLSAASPGRQIEVNAASLAASGVRVDFVTGALDAKFVKVAQTLAEEMRVCLGASGVTEARVTESVVPGAGHAAHLEAPEALVLRLLRAIRTDEEL